MRRDTTVDIFLETGLLNSARTGDHNFIGLVQRVLETNGFQVQFHHEDACPKDHDGLSLVHMKPPLGRKGLTFRRVYHYPFWQIDQSERRWMWDVARTRFDPSEIDPSEARRFQRYWRKRLFGGEEAQQTRDGPVFVPLQGKLREHRSFQKMSPIQMLETTLHLDPKRDIIATLHPKEHYSSADHAALSRLTAAHARLSIRNERPSDILPRCAYVVTENSGVAFDGYFFNRPAVLFAKIDFHHIGQSLTRMAAADAFEQVLSDRPDFEKYVYWFWQNQSINAGRDDAQDKIRARFEKFGWLK